LNGSSMPLTFHLMSAPDGAVTGTMEGRRRCLPRFTTASWTATHHFFADHRLRGQTYKLVFKGRLLPDRLTSRLERKTEAGAGN